MQCTQHGGGEQSYREKLVRVTPGVFEHACNFENVMETEAESDDEFEVLTPGDATVHLFGHRKNQIRATWANALIVKVFGKIVGFHFLHSRLFSLWKPSGRMDCIDLGCDFFLIRLSSKDDHSRVLREGSWFIGGHYLSIRGCEPNFRPELASLSTIAVWVCLHALPIEYYEPSVLRDIGKAIGPILCIDTHTALEARGRFARLSIQVNFDKPIIKLLKIGGIDQSVQYEGISSLCFSCGRVGHKVECCPYSVRKPDTPVDGSTGGDLLEIHSPGNEVVTEPKAFGPWVLVSFKKKPTKKKKKNPRKRMPPIPFLVTQPKVL